MMSTWIETVEELAPLIQPHVDKARIIVVDDLRGAARKVIGRRLAKHMADARARQNLKAPAAHPHLMWRGWFRFWFGVCLFFFCLTMR